jgi:hypothetical protein
VFTINTVTESVDTELVPPKSMINVLIDHQNCQMELDTGATLSSMSLADFRQICPAKPLEPTNIQLRGYFGEVKRALGRVNVRIQHGDVTTNQNLYIFDEKVDAICGRLWTAAANIKYNL